MGIGYPTMTSETEGVGFLRVELGKFARTTRISAERVSRQVAFPNCLVTSWTVMSLGDITKLSKNSFSEGGILELFVRERMPGEWPSGDGSERCARLSTALSGRKSTSLQFKLW